MGARITESRPWHEAKVLVQNPRIYPHMERAGHNALVRDLMRDFASRTGLDPVSYRTHRYLWTDAFAVCNYLGLSESSGTPVYRDLAIRLVGQVHTILGRYRDDDFRNGWISGLSESEGKNRPTAGGLRIGKDLPERQPGETEIEREEWDRDGQYYHYLTRWMHALCRVASVTGDRNMISWAIELAQTAHAKFTYLPPGGRTKRMYWKMSTDLRRPLVYSMGQHDALDGFVTYNEISATAEKLGLGTDILGNETAEMTTICQGLVLATDDPLGIGGLLCDAFQIVTSAKKGVPAHSSLLESVLVSARAGLESFSRSGTVSAPARYRLGFRELGLSLGLAAAIKLHEELSDGAKIFANRESLHRAVQALQKFLPLRDEIDAFWLDEKNRTGGTWEDHRDINEVMLATSLAPDGYLA